MELQQFNPILYLMDYEDVPEDFCRWKQDEELHSGWRTDWIKCGNQNESLYGIEVLCKAEQAVLEKKEIVKQNSVSGKLCVGIGKYHTEMDGDIFLCTLLDRMTREIVSCSFGVYRSPELVKKALEIFFQIYPLSDENNVTGNKRNQICLLSSRNPIYQRQSYHKIIAQFPIQPEMTLKGTRGGAAVVSTYFSQLMRRKVSTIFYTWQDAIDWLSGDITRYNQEVRLWIEKN